MITSKKDGIYPLSPSPHKSNCISVKFGGCLLVLIFFCFTSVIPAGAGTGSDYWSPWVTKLSTTQATINWRGTAGATGSVEYATASYYNQHQKFDKTATSSVTVSYQHVLLAGLETNTSYIYRVRPSDNADIFANRTFRTMPASGPFTFIVISDSQEGHHYTEEMRFKYVADAVAREQDVLFILHGGDYAGFDDWAKWTVFFQVADGMLAKFPIFTTIGNHEYHNPEGEGNPPTTADQYHWSYDTSLNYSFDCAGIRFIILNSPDPTNTDSDDPHTSLALAQSQAPWLESKLSNDLLGTFTMHHHPIWEYGRTGIDSNLKPWETLYHTYRISANFAGHVHNYQRFSVEGIPYFILGTAGGRFADINAGDPYPVWYVCGQTRKLGYLKITVDPANNTATAQQIFVAVVQEDDSGETPQVYDPPVIGDSITFHLSSKSSDGRSSFKCFIATAAFGSYFNPYVQILRDFRNRYLVTTRIGRSFINWYYKVSPPIANFIGTGRITKTAARIFLFPVVGFAYLCLTFGVLPTFLLLLFCVAAICWGIRRSQLFRHNKLIKTG